MTSQMIDWDFAVGVGTRTAGPGPEVSAEEARAVVSELREGAAVSTPLVRDYTGLTARDHSAPVLVVDRGGWVRANADSFSVIFDPLVSRLAAKRGEPTAVTKAIGSRVTGGEIGFILGFMGSRVLGQFDPFHAPDGRLLLVAPNVVHVERELDVDPHDFRLWVCLHEETHRVQFTAVPWMKDHLLSQMTALIDLLDPSAVLERGPSRIAQALREEGNLMEAVSTPEQREMLDRITGIMSLLEGHADVVMDGVGPEVIGTVAQIRSKFNRRRKGAGPLDRVFRRLLGLEAKMAQYRDGAVFVRSVLDRAGMEQFNAVWAEPGNLPDKAEINDPDAWMRRVLG